MSKYLSVGTEWNFDTLKRYDNAISELAHGFGLDTYPNQIEVISAEQMLDAYSTVGMPIGYHHWSFGKHFVNAEKNYRRGTMGLAYEIVINSNPCIAYLMEENSIIMQAMVIAHACYGHNSFFKNNYLFQQWTDAESIIDYLLFAKSFIQQCEQKYGIEEVEATLDACHALMNHGVDRYQRPTRLSLQNERLRQRNREQYRQAQVNDLWRTLPKKAQSIELGVIQRFPTEPQENILYFIEKNAPNLENWQREIIRIVRKIAQYFYPQRQTKVMNEGWATFWHYTLIYALYDKGLVTDEFMLEFIQHHTNVTEQPAYDDQRFMGINPYTLGYYMFRDIRRMCEEPTAEDHQYFPEIAGKDWITTLDFAMRNFKDESFINQYLSPKLIRDLRLFCVTDDENKQDLEVTAIHNEKGYDYIRQTLAKQFDLSYTEPDIQVYNVNIASDRTLYLRHNDNSRRPLNENTHQVLKYLHRLWKFPVILETVDANQSVIALHEYPQKNELHDKILE